MTYDVAIVGGGLVGNVLACALGIRGLKVAAIEAKPPAAKPGPALDPRVSAITRGSERILRALGVWEHLPPERIGTFREMHVWDAPGHGEIHFQAAQIAEPSLGHIIENHLIQFALSKRLTELDSVTCYQPAELHGVWLNEDSARVKLADQELQANLVVGADGTDSKVRELAGIQSRQGEYGQHALVVIVQCGKDHRETAWQRFFSTGPLAVLPLPDNLACIVWSSEPEHTASLKSMSAESFAQTLTDALEYRLGEVECQGERLSFPLRWLQAEEYVRHRLALVGDAAHTIHPLAGQGVNLGLYDAGVLAEVIAEAHDRGRDPSRRWVLRRYERRRRGPNLIMHGAMDGFFWLFGSRLPGVKAIRNLGLAVTDGLNPVKRLIMRHASGLSGDLPALAREVATRH